MLLILISPPRTLKAVEGGSAAGPSHSRHSWRRSNSVAFGAKRTLTGRPSLVRLLGGEIFSLSDMIVLYCYEDDEPSHFDA